MLTPRAPDPATPASGDATISIEFAHRGSRLQAVIRATGEKRGTRVLEDDGPSCAPLAEATALAIAILVDPEAAAAAVAKEENPPTATAEDGEQPIARRPIAPPRESPAPTTTGSRETQRRGTRWGASIDGGAGMMTGVNASVSPFFAIGLALRPVELFSFEVSALIGPSRSHDLDRGAVEVSFIGGGAAGCIWPIANAGPAAIDVGGCLGGIVTSVRGEGRGYDSDRSAARAWGALDAHLAMNGALVGPVGWGLRAGAVVPLHRESFGVAGAGTAYEMASIGSASMIVVTAKIR
ncbi:MAG: hypothetical protein JST00_06675 [Deltaproteobacteria bacterium]|nr:hypothetical protein [Deltaproteobacteria bacterium]